MSLLLRGDSEVAAKSNSRSVINQVALRLHNFKDRAATMDITDLNLFAWCAFLKHLGKTIMLLVVSGIIGLAAYATFSSALLPGIEDTGNAGVKFGYILLSIIYVTTVLMVLWSYMATMTTDPGTTPPGWHPFELPNDNNNAANDLETGQTNLDTVSSSLQDPLIANRLSDYFQASIRLQQQEAYTSSQRNATSTLSSTTGDDSDPYELPLAIMERPRWCKKCSAWKPPRAHHCSMTRRCVLKMDHYCVWVGNTVGLLNYKYFVLFLFWACVGCFMSAALLLKPTIHFFSANDPTLRPLVTSFLAFVFTAAFCVALLGFVIMHSRLVFINQSTIEAYEKRPLQPWPYDQGYNNNFIDVFGSKKRLWFVPILPEEHRRRLLSETLDVVAVPLPSESTWQGGNFDFSSDLDHPVHDGVGVYGGPVASSDNSGRAVSPSEEPIGSALGMVLIERPNTS